MNVLLFMMGGRGTRFGSQIPKQFYEIKGKPLFNYILEDLCIIKCIDKICVLTNPEYHDYTKKNMISSDKIIEIIDGGQGRSKDILLCLERIKNIVKEEDNILIYDATHPFVDDKGINEVVTKLDEGYKAVTLAEYQYDTTYTIYPDTNVVNSVTQRNEQIVGASPEAFKFGILYNIFSKSTPEELDSMTSAGYVAIKNKIELLAVKTELINLKITYPHDIDLVEQLINNYGKINGERRK